MIKLDKRLRAVVNEVQGKTLADIGCDHGKVSVASILEGKVKNVIACDISKDSLEKAKKLALQYNIKNMQCRLGDGLRPLNDNEVDCAVIAGMGGNEIMSILSEDLKGICRFVLVAHRNTIELRAFLSHKGFFIQKDYLVYESGKFYDIIVALKNTGKDCKISERQLYIGLNTYTDDFMIYSRHIRQKYSKLKDYEQKSEQAKTIANIFKYCMQTKDIKVKDIIKEIEKHAPLSLMLDFDSAGLNQGNEEDSLRGVLLAQNVSFATLEEAREKDCNLLLTHHPSVFGEEIDDYTKEILAKAEEYKINLYSCHTNLDCCKDGLNDFVSNLLELKNIKIIDGCAREGSLKKPLCLKEWAKRVADELKDKNVKYVGDDDKIIKKVAVCTGAGARDDELVEYAKNNDIDCIVGGESKLSIALKIKDYKIALVDVGHYTSEIFCIDIFKSWLEDKFGDFLKISEKDIDPYKSIG